MRAFRRGFATCLVAFCASGRALGDCPLACPPGCVNWPPSEAYHVGVSVSADKLLPVGTDSPEMTQWSEVTAAATLAGRPAGFKFLIFTVTAMDSPGHKVEKHAPAARGVLEGGFLDLLHGGIAPMVIGTTGEDGKCTVRYLPPRVAADVHVEVSMMEKSSNVATAAISVGVELGSFPASGLGYVFKPADSCHTDNKGAVAELRSVAGRIAEIYAGRIMGLPDEERARYAPTLRFTDASLPRGGLYDIAQERDGTPRIPPWAAPHTYHRYGYDLDIAVMGAAGDDLLPVHEDTLRKAMQVALNEPSLPGVFPIYGGLLFEGNHYHMRARRAVPR